MTDKKSRQGNNKKREGGVYIAKSKKACRFLKTILVKSWTLPNEIINIMNFNFYFSKWHPDRMYYILYCSPYPPDSLSKTRDMQWENGAKNDGKVRTLVCLKSNKNDIRPLLLKSYWRPYNTDSERSNARVL